LVAMQDDRSERRHGEYKLTNSFIGAQRKFYIIPNGH